VWEEVCGWKVVLLVVVVVVEESAHASSF